MVTKNSLKELIAQAVKTAGLHVEENLLQAITVDYPDSRFGDFSTNVSMVLSKPLKMNPLQVAEVIMANIAPDYFQKIEIAGPGFINFFIKDDFLLAETQIIAQQGLVKPNVNSSEKILLEYFQPNIAKPLHVGHLRTAIIGDSIKRMLLYSGYKVESDTHMGDWGTQIGYLILAYKKYDYEAEGIAGEINKINELYIKVTKEAEKDPSLHELAKQEFVKLEQGDEKNKSIWKRISDWSSEGFRRIDDMIDIDIMKNDETHHHWPESFYEPYIPSIVEKLKKNGLLEESKGAQIVNLENVGLGIAIIIKSDGGSTYLLRDLATFIYRRDKGFDRQLYVVDSRQSHSFKQLFAILMMLGEMKENEAVHVDYGFISFGGSVLSTRKGNMVTAIDVLTELRKKVAGIIHEKNPDLKDKNNVVQVIAIGALKYFDLSHNRHSDIEFDWDEALSFEGNSGPYLQYVYARLASILRKETLPQGSIPSEIETSATERQIMFELTKFNDIVADSLQDYLPNVLANYLYNLAALTNKFYHESPVIKETDESKKQFRLALVTATQKVLGQGLSLLGIKPLEEM